MAGDASGIRIAHIVKEYTAVTHQSHLQKYLMLEKNYHTTYDQWNLALAEHFYNKSQAGKPVYLQVDDDLLRHVASEIGIPQNDGRAAFVAAVRYRSRLNDDPFFKFFQWKGWETQLKTDPTTPPPFVAFLGLCVLAAFDMANDENVSSANYYVRLEELLNAKRPKKFDDVGELWERLNRWLDDDLEQKYGRATASYVNRRHVGYPISQALLRMSEGWTYGKVKRWGRVWSDYSGKWRSPIETKCCQFFQWVTKPKPGEWLI